MTKMVTLRTYIDLSQAERDRSLLQAVDIPAFLAGENSASAGYGSVLGELRLQVQEADVERARRALDEHEGFSPLPDDFIPPEEESPAAPGGGGAFIWGGLAMLSVFCIAAALWFGASGSTHSTVGGLVFLILASGLVGLAAAAISRRGRTDGSKTSRR